VSLSTEPTPEHQGSQNPTALEGNRRRGCGTSHGRQTCVAGEIKPLFHGARFLTTQGPKLNLKAQLEQKFRGDLLLAPGHNVRCHVRDQLTHIGGNSWTTQAFDSISKTVENLPDATESKYQAWRYSEGLRAVLDSNLVLNGTPGRAQAA
jgi:hypothetical protein